MDIKRWYHIGSLACKDVKYVEFLCLYFLQSETLPRTAMPPKHTYVLERCEITEVPKKRTYAFRVFDTKTREEIVLACDNVAEYASWISFLTGDKLKPLDTAPRRGDEEDEAIASEEEKESGPSESVAGYHELSPGAADTISQYFKRRNIDTVVFLAD